MDRYDEQAREIVYGKGCGEPLEKAIASALRAAATVQEGCVRTPNGREVTPQEYIDEYLSVQATRAGVWCPKCYHRPRLCVCGNATVQPRVTTIDEAQPTVENMERAMGQVDGKAVQDG